MAARYGLDAKRLAEDVSLVRSARGMSWTAFEAETGVPERTVSRMRAGSTPRTDVTLTLLAWLQVYRGPYVRDRGAGFLGLDDPDEEEVTA